MNARYDKFGEPVEPDTDPDDDGDPTTPDLERTPDELHADCEQLRQIIRDRRQVRP